MKEYIKHDPDGKKYNDCHPLHLTPEESENQLDLYTRTADILARVLAGERVLPYELLTGYETIASCLGAILDYDLDIMNSVAEVKFGGIDFERLNDERLEKLAVDWWRPYTIKALELKKGVKAT